MGNSKPIDISIGIDALLENGFFYLEKKQWKRSKEYFEKVIEISPRNAQAYVGLLLVANKLSTLDSLPNCSKPFANNNHYKSALRYGDEELVLKLKRCLALYNEKREKEYQDACEKLEKARSREDYEHCYETFCKLGEHKNSEAMAERAKEAIDIFEYETCVAKMNDNLTEKEYSELSDRLSKIKYKDSENLANKCKARYESLAAARKENERKEKIYSSACLSYGWASSIKDILSVKESFESIANYKDSKEWISKCQNKLDNKKIAFSVYKIWNNNSCLIGIACALVVLFGIAFSNSLTVYMISITICLGVGIFVAWTGNWKSLGKALIIATVVGVLLALLAGATPSSGKSKGSGTCGVCGGSGTVTSKILGTGSGIQKGFTTYYLCKGCHGTGRD